MRGLWFLSEEGTFMGIIAMARFRPLAGIMVLINQKEVDEKNIK